MESAGTIEGADESVRARDVLRTSDEAQGSCSSYDVGFLVRPAAGSSAGREGRWR